MGEQRVPSANVSLDNVIYSSTVGVIMESDFLTIFCIVVAFVVGYFFNDVISMIFNSKPMDDQAYQEEQRRRLEASKNNRKIDNEFG